MMFGRMLGHLRSAKSRLETERGWSTTQLNLKAQERLQEKLSLSKMNIQEFRKSAFEQQKKEEEAKVKELDKAIQEKELLLLQKRLEEHYSLMMNFIRTKAEPTIFYLPAKHTTETEQMLEETRTAIKHKIASLQVHLQSVPEPDDPEAAEEDALRASAAAAAVAAAEGAVDAATAGAAKEEEEESGAKDDAKDGDDDAKDGADAEAKEAADPDSKEDAAQAKAEDTGGE